MKNTIIASALSAASLIGFAPATHAYGDLSLVNAVTNQTVGTPIIYIRDYDLTLIGDQINFRYNHEVPFGPETKSVRFIVSDSDGAVISDRVENQAPFAAFGDNNGDYYRVTAYGTGFAIDATAYSEKFAQGDEVGGSVFLASFSRSEPVNAGLTIINADSNAQVASVANGQTFSLADIGSNLNLNAEFGDLGGQIGSVVFDQISGVDTTPQKIENVAPYALFGDISGDFKGQEFSAGTVSVRVRAFSGGNGSGTELADMTYVFTLTD